MEQFCQSNCLKVEKSKIAENGNYNLSGDRYRFATDYVVKEKNKLNPKYLFCYSPLFKEEFERVSGKATFGFVSVATLQNFAMPLPPLAIQNQIVEEIEAERALVESAQKLIAIYEQKTKATIAKLWEE
jgi:restriction endonuclease S subunit